MKIRIAPSDSPSIVWIGPRHTVLLPLRAELTGWDGELSHVDRVTITAGMTDDGTIRATTIEVSSVEGEGLRSVDLRKLPLGQLVTNSVAKVVASELRISSVVGDRAIYSTGPSSVLDLDDDELSRLRDLGPVKETLEVAADMHEFARVVGWAPTKFTAEKFGVSTMTIVRWMQRARELGLVEGER